jgi:hypothetical protein
MEEIVKQITDKWKKVIESTNVNGYSRKVESIDCFRMNKHYTGYPEIEFCYKVTFNFEDGISLGFRSFHHSVNQIQNIYSNNLRHATDNAISHTNPSVFSDVSVFNTVSKEKWNKRLEDRFTNMFYDFPEISPKSGTEEWWKLNLNKPRPGSNSGETKFENSKVDYMTNQGYRFIIQFYPQEFISELREDKLTELLS